MAPAQQRLGAHHLPGAERHERLIVQLEPGVGERGVQVRHQAEPPPRRALHRRLEEHVRVAAARLRRVQRHVGQPREAFARRLRMIAADDADAGADAQGEIVERDGLVERRDQPLRRRRRLASIRRVPEDHRELVAAEPREQVVLPQHRAEPARHHLQHLVAHQMAVQVVDGLEVVEVQIQQRTRQVRRGVHLHLELMAIGELRERVEVGQSRERGTVLATPRDVGADAAPPHRRAILVEHALARDRPPLLAAVHHDGHLHVAERAVPLQRTLQRVDGCRTDGIAGIHAFAEVRRQRRAVQLFRGEAERGGETRRGVLQPAVEIELPQPVERVLLEIVEQQVHHALLARAVSFGHQASAHLLRGDAHRPQHDAGVDRTEEQQHDAIGIGVAAQAHEDPDGENHHVSRCGPRHRRQSESTRAEHPDGHAEDHGAVLALTRGIAEDHRHRPHDGQQARVRRHAVHRALGCAFRPVAVTQPAPGRKADGGHDGRRAHPHGQRPCLDGVAEDPAEGSHVRPVGEQHPWGQRDDRLDLERPEPGRLRVRGIVWRCPEGPHERRVEHEIGVGDIAGGTVPPASVSLFRTESAGGGAA